MSGHVQDLLSAYLDGELSPPERAMVEAHLAACDACAARLDDFAVLDAAVRELPVEAPAGYFEAFPGRVRARVRGRGEPAGRWHVPVWGWAAAAALLLAVLTPLTLRRLPGPAVEPLAAPATAGEAAPATAGEAAPTSALDGTLASEPKRAQNEAPRVSTRERPRALGYEDGDATARVEPRRAEPRPPEPSSAAAPEGQAAAHTGELAKTHRATTTFAATPPAARHPAEEAALDQPRSLEERTVGAGAAARQDVPVSVLDAAPEPARSGAAWPTAPATPAARDADARAERETAESDHKGKAAAGLDAGAAAPRAASAGARGRASSAPPSPQDGAAGEEFALLRERTAAGVSTLEAARTLRDDWRSFAARNPTGPRGDEARWQVIEAGWRAFRLGRDTRDHGVLARDARTYLERSDAAHVVRVRAILAELERD